MAETEIGKVEHFFDKASVVALKLTAGLRVGDTLRVHGHTTDFTMVVSSMQIQHAAVKEAKAGQDVGIKVPDACRVGDAVSKVVAEK